MNKYYEKMISSVKLEFLQTLNVDIEIVSVCFQIFHKNGGRSNMDQPSMIPIDPPILPKRT